MIHQFNNGKLIKDNILDPSFINLIDKYPLIIADPPYGDIVKEKWDNWGYKEYIELAKVIEKALTKGGSAYVWGGIGKYKNRTFFKFLANVEEETNLHLRNVITWNKKRAYGKSDDYLFTREEVAWLVNGDNPEIFNIPLLDEKRGYAGYNAKYPAKSEYKRRTNVWTDITEVFSGKKHKCEKPEKLAEVMINTHTNPGDEVLDLFAGSGNTSLVASRLGRRFVAVENDEMVCKLLLERLNETLQA